MSIQEETEKKFMEIYERVRPLKQKLSHINKKSSTTGWGLYDKPHFAVSKKLIKEIAKEKPEMVLGKVGNTIVLDAEKVSKDILDEYCDNIGLK